MRILVVEDEHKIANSIKKGLELENFAVDVVYDGASGYDYASSEEYDVIVLDLMLPGIDGLTITQKLRQKSIQTPILILTAKGQVEDKVAGLNSGADDYLVKPFAFTELLARVRALLRRPQRTNGRVLKVADLTLDTVSYEVKRGNQTLKLSSREFALLEYLMRHPGIVLTKEQIINHVWNYDADILPNTVEVFIGYLRKKVDRISRESPLIKTVRGFGYKISKDI